MTTAASEASWPPSTASSGAGGAPAGGIVLAGGRSRRMGAPKAGLEWHGSTMVRRVAGIVARSVDGPVVVVRAAGQVLPALPARCLVAEDGRAGRGPLEGLAAGLQALAGRAEVAFVAAADTPLLHPAFIAAVLGGLREEDEICVAIRDGIDQPLAGAYRASVAPALADLLAGDQLRVGLLLERCRVRRLDAAALLADGRLAATDPRLDSLLGVNDPDELAAARARPAPRINLTPPGGSGAIPARAATLGEAAATAGLTLGDGVLATLNGSPAGEDGQLPLVDGDEVSFAIRGSR